VVFAPSKESIEAAKILQRNRALPIPEHWLELVLNTIGSLTPEVREAALRSAEDNGVSLENLFLGGLKSRGLF
jgi:hypothetical protein